MAITSVALALRAHAQTAPPAPSLVAPASGTSLVQPIVLDWNPVEDPDGPIGNYTWQVGTSSTFATIIAEGAQNLLSDAIPTRTADKVSGLPNGTYFWRVKATALVGGSVGSLESPWSQVRTFTVTGLGTAPAAPSFTSPVNGSAFHPFESFHITWTPVADALYYVLEADEEPSFSHPLSLTTDSMQFGTNFTALWGNELNIYYRVRSVSSENIRGLPSATLNIHISNTASVPPAPALLSPAAGATVSTPIRFDWTDSANPQIPGYDLDIDDEPAFAGDFGVVLVQNISRSDYMLAEDVDLHLPPGTYYWRVRALHGSVAGPWSQGKSFNVTAQPATPPGLDLFWIINEPGSVYGGNPTQARVTLNRPAGPGGALVHLASDLPQTEVPSTVLVPEGKTDAWLSPVTSVPVRGATIGRLRAAFGQGWQQSSIGMFPILWGLALNDDNAIGGETVAGTVTLLNPAPAGGLEVTLVSSDADLVSIPGKIFIPAGQLDATFNLSTAPVSETRRVVINSGTAFENYRAPETSLILRPPSTPEPPASLSDLNFAASSILGESTTTATVTLTAPAPAGGAVVTLNGSMEGQVVTPRDVLVPEGSTSATFTITAPQVNKPHYVLIQAGYGSALHTKLIEIVPAPAGEPTLLAFGVRPRSIIGGNATLGTVGLAMPAPEGGGAVTLSTDQPLVVDLPASVFIEAGNSANSFTINTHPVQTFTSVRIDATAGGITKSAFLDVSPDPNAPPALLSVTLSVSGAVGGNSVPATIFLNKNAPAGGASVTLATSNSSATQVPSVINVPGGQGWANFTITTFPVSANTQVTITGTYGGSTKSANLTVMPGSSPPPAPGTPSLLSPANDASVAQPITLDWSDASNAASYEIQVDDSSTFSAPLVRSLTSSASQTTVTGLSTVRHWWRVRARNSAGAAGNWSSSRRFRPQAAPSAATLSGISLNPASVPGGNNSQATVTLSSAAPSGGAVVSITSSSSDAIVPASVAVPAGASSASFAISTRSVAASTTAVISATQGGITRTVTLTINSVSAGPLSAPALASPGNDARFSPGQNIVFDWSDVSGAASYTLQIDDRDSFPEPQIVNRTVTSSTFSSSTLPTRTMWWRVRANDASGNPGNWSTVRRFEVKD